MKKNKIVLFGLLAITLLLANSCEDPWFNCIRGNGDVSEELRNVGDFTAIDSEGDFEVFVTIGPYTDVVVEAESNLLDYIETDVRNGKLTIDTRRNRCLRNEEPMRIFITTPHLNDIELDGSGFIECEGIVSSYLNVDLNGSGDIRLGADAEYIDADISGSGEIELWGTTHETEFKISGSGQIKSFDLITDKSFLTITGSGSIYVLAFDFLDVKITGSGNVYYKGNPGVHVNITGSGDLIHW